MPVSIIIINKCFFCQAETAGAGFQNSYTDYKPAEIASPPQKKAAIRKKKNLCPIYRIYQKYIQNTPKKPRIPSKRTAFGKFYRAAMLLRRPINFFTSFVGVGE